MSRECTFELSLIRCAECERVTEEIGTCEDFAWCVACQEIFRNANGYTPDEWQRAYGQIKIASIEGHKYRPKVRVLHFDTGSGVACHARGGPHPVTVDRNATNCKRCLRAMESN